ncbi:MAG: VIT domain-containing protein [Pirellulales bacterium]
MRRIKSVRELVWASWGFFLALMVLGSNGVQGQGILVIESDSYHWHLPRPIPRPPVPEPSIPLLYRVKSVEIDAKIVQSVVRVQMSQTFVNEGSQTVEARCIMPVPYDAVVDGITFMVDGKEIEGKILPVDEARRVYQSYVRKSQDPALVQWIGSGLLQTQVFPIPPGAERTVSISYNHVLRKTNRMVEWFAPLKAAGYSSHPIEKLSIQVYIEDTQKLGNIYSPTHTIDVKRSSDHSATVRYSTVSQVPMTDFRLIASSTDSPLVADFLGYAPDRNEAGYFLLLLHPDFEAQADQTPKDIVLVLDKSGSMRGKKIDQARQALLYILNHLPKHDRIGIVVYDSQITTFREDLIDASDTAMLESAKSFVNTLSASGSTNIDQALDTALKMVSKSDRPAYIVHLSDGIPTVGERDERQIVAHATKANRNRSRIFNFGVGHDVNSKLMNRLSAECFGQTFFVAPDEDIEASVSGLYDRLGQPALSDVRWEMKGSGTKVTSVYPTKIMDLFSGDQTSIAGRFEGTGIATLVVRGMLGKKEMQYEQTIDLDSVSKRADKSFVATLWASRRVAALIEEIDLEGKKEELVKELIHIAKKYGILTEYTAFLAEEPLGTRTASSVRDETFRRLGALEQESGTKAFSQRQIAKSQSLADNMEANERSQSLARGAGMGMGYGMGSEARIPGRPEVASQAAGPRARPSSPMRRSGDRVFFQQKEGQWLDSKVGETIPTTAKKVTKFSDEYFALLEKHMTLLQPLLDLNEPIVVELEGVVYIL